MLVSVCGILLQQESACCIVVSVLAGPIGCVFESGQGDGLLKGDKNPQHTFVSDGK
jgi:hypothetical protein